MIQILIALVGPLGVWLSQDKSIERQKWACIVGLLGQLMYFYVFYTHQEWGLFIAAFAYTYAWIKGLFHFWIRKENKEDK